jgi:hypothetical protein
VNSSGNNTRRSPIAIVGYSNHPHRIPCFGTCRPCPSVGSGEVAADRVLHIGRFALPPGSSPRRSRASVAADRPPACWRANTTRHHASTTWPSGRRSRVDRALFNALSSSCSNRVRSASGRPHRSARPARPDRDRSPTQPRVPQATIRHAYPTARPMLHPRCIAVLGRFRVERRANGEASSVMAGSEDGGLIGAQWWP